MAGRASHEEDDLLAVLLRFAEFGRRMTIAIEDAIRDPDLARNSPLIVLTTLRLEGPQRPGDLQERTGLTSGGVTKLLQRLEQDGLVARHHGRVPGDRRAVVVTLTDEGNEHLGQVARDFGRHFHEVEGFTREATELVAGLRRVATAGADD